MTEPSRAAASACWTVAGAILIACGLVVGAIVAGDAVLPTETELIRAVQSPAWPGLDTLAWAASRVGDVWPGLLLVAFAMAGICLVLGHQWMAFLFVAAAALRSVNSPLKWAFASPRPPVEYVRAGEIADGFGYPSGHAFGAALVFGAVAIFAPRLIANRPLCRVVQGAAILIALLIALSRVRLGVHWPSDIAGGAIIGLGLVCLLNAAFHAWENHRVRT